MSLPPDDRVRKRRFPLWPLVLLIVVLAGLAGFWKEALNSLGSRVESMERVDLESTHAASDKAVTFIHEVESALAERGIGMTVVAMPYREDLYPRRKSPAKDLVERPGFYPMVAWAALQRLRHDGTVTIDLWDDFYTAAGEGNLYEDDFCHLRDAHETTIGNSLVAKLRDAGVFDDGSGHLTVLGECFAETFGDTIREHLDLPDSEVKILRGSADRGRIPNQLFRFDEVYLENCRHVVWVVPYILLRHEKFPPLATNPQPIGGAADELQVTLRVKKGLTMAFEEMRAATETMPYEDALAEIRFETADESGEIELPDGGGILIAWAARKRVRSGLEHLRDGDLLHATLYEWDAYTAHHPEISGAFFLETIDEFDPPRYWLDSWVKKVD